MPSNPICHYFYDCIDQSIINGETVFGLKYPPVSLFVQSFFVQSDTKKLYAEAMRDGYVERKIIKCLVIGAAGVGKTTIKHLLLGEKPPEKRVSTGVLENPIRAVSISKAGYCNGSWVKVESDDELMKMIAEAIKSGKVPKERNNSGGHLAVGLQNDNENNSDGSVPVTQRDRDIGSSQVEPEYTSESIHTEFVAAINNTEGMDNL